MRAAPRGLPNLYGMASTDRIEFGSVLDRDASDRKLWLVIIPIVVLVLGLVAWAVAQGSKAGDLRRQLRAEQQQTGDLQKTVAERDNLLKQAHVDEAIQQSPGTAVALFYGVNPQAEESGVVFAHPAEKAARVYLYGLTAAPAGQAYVVAARTADGKLKPLGDVVPGNDGGGFLLAKDLPSGTNAIELVLQPQGDKTLDRAEPRVAARYPANGERGVLTQAPAVQARRGRR
jgi:hypothetical protein